MLNLNLRLATLEDVFDIVEMAEAFHNNSPYSFMEFDYVKVEAMVKEFIEDHNERRVIFVVTDNDIPIGCVASAVSEGMMSMDLLTTEYIWYVEPEYRKTPAGKLLWEAHRYWSEQMEVDGYVAVHLETKHAKALGRFYEKQGFKKFETTYVMQAV